MHLSLVGVQNPLLMLGISAGHQLQMLDLIPPILFALLVVCTALDTIGKR